MESWFKRRTRLGIPREATRMHSSEPLTQFLATLSNYRNICSYFTKLLSHRFLHSEARSVAWGNHSNLNVQHICNSSDISFLEPTAQSNVSAHQLKIHYPAMNRNKVLIWLEIYQANSRYWGRKGIWVWHLGEHLKVNGWKMQEPRIR